MRSFLLSKIIVPLHLALVAGFLAWVQPGPENVAAFLPLVFLSLGFVAVMLLFPSARKGEDVFDARARSVESLKHDFFFVFGILALAFAVVQTLNGPRQLVYVRSLRAWEYTSGIIRSFPACLDMLLSSQTFFMIVAVDLAVLAVRNSMGKRGRRLAVEFVLAVSTVLGLCGLVQYARTPALDAIGVKLPPPETFATFASKTEAGAFFLMCSCAAFGLLFMEMVKDDAENDDNRGKFAIRFLFVAFVVNVVSALFTLSCLSIAGMCIALLIVAIYTFVFVIVASPGELGLSTVAAIVILGAVAGFLHFVAYPENRLHDCTEKIFEGPWTTQEEKAERTALTEAAWRMFGDNAAGGVGASCYGLESGYPKYLENKDWSALRDPDARHWRCGNDFAQFLAEYGVAGTFLLLAPFVVLALSVVLRIWMLARYGTKYKQGIKSTTATEADRIGVFEIMPPDALALFVGAATATVISFFVPVFGSQLNIYTWAVFFVVASASLPKPRRTIFKQGRQ